MKLSLKSAIVFFLIAAQWGCECNKIRKNRNLSGIDFDFKINRLDNILFRLSPENLQVQYPAIDSIYNGFLSFYVNVILGLGDYKTHPDATIAKLNKCLNDSYVKEVRDSCEKVFDDFSKYEKELKQALRYYKYYFPQKNIPDVVTFM